MRHPREFGFELGLRITAGGRGATTYEMVSPSAKIDQSVVYVAMLPDGTALKVGVASRGLAGRWKGIVGVMHLPADSSRLKPHEVRHGDQLNEWATGGVVEVWFKPAEQIEIPYAKGLPAAKFSAANAEEVFLDSYYQPRFGQALSRRDHFR